MAEENHLCSQYWILFNHFEQLTGEYSHNVVGTEQLLGTLVTIVPNVTFPGEMKYLRPKKSFPAIKAAEATDGSTPEIT